MSAGDQALPSSVSPAESEPSIGQRGNFLTTRPLQDRVAVFLRSMREENSAVEQTSCPPVDSGTTATLTTDSSRPLPCLRTLSPVQSLQQTILLAKQDHPRHHLISEGLPDGSAARTKRLRSEGNMPVIALAQDCTNKQGEYEAGSSRKPMARPLIATWNSSASVSPTHRLYRPTFVPRVQQDTTGHGSRQTVSAEIPAGVPGVQFPFAAPPQLMPSGFHPPVVDSASGSTILHDLTTLVAELERGAPSKMMSMNSELLAEQVNIMERLSPLQRAELDWEIHIRAIERVLETNCANGLPSDTIPLDALQVLSQMISNLSILNTKLLYAQMQTVLDAHHRNAQRINDVFQGLAGQPKRQRTHGQTPPHTSAI